MIHGITTFILVGKFNEVMTLQTQITKEY